MANNSRWKHIWITGASSGIGQELATDLAKQGSTVSASARSQDKLEELARSNANVSPHAVDVADPAAVALAYARLEDQNGPVDLAILNAGVWAPSESGALEMEEFGRSMSINYLGVTNALVPLLGSMRARGRGHIVIVASVAGYRGLPKGAYYGPTKAALINLCESLYPDLRRAGIKLQVVNPGFVRTPMTDVNRFPMPFLMETDDAVRALIAGLDSNRFEIAFPWQLVWSLKLARILPYAAFFSFVRNVIARDKHDA
ncbi:MAG: SDR family NAD(P)-dependent oxidoreductase [Aestuariivirgaceae bacterium]